MSFRPRLKTRTPEAVVESGACGGMADTTLRCDASSPGMGGAVLFRSPHNDVLFLTSLPDLNLALSLQRHP